MENVTEAVKTEKPKRKRRTKSEIAAELAAAAKQQAPLQAIAELEMDILSLVKQRSAAKQEITSATGAAALATARVQSAHQQLQNLEKEVQYRLQLIGQMKGGTTQQFTLQPLPGSLIGAAQDAQLATDMFQHGISSIPTPAIVHPAQFETQMSEPNTGRRIRGESAADVRGMI